jgi:hypothetical protein
MHRSARQLALLAACTSCTPGPVLLRSIEDGNHGRLEVAWIELSPPPGRPPVALLNMVHVGAPEYFAAVQSRLDRASIVLMEGVVRERSSNGAPRDPKKRRGADLFELAATFRLVHQLDALERRPHFRSADMSESEFRDMAPGPRAGTGPSLRDLQRDANYEVFRFQGQHPELDANAAGERVRRGMARRILARHIATYATDDRRRPVVVLARNQIALRALDQCAATGEVVLCWGFAHGQDFLRALGKRGYRVATVTWREVFRY